LSVVLRALSYKATLLQDPFSIEGSDQCGMLVSIGPMIITSWSSWMSRESKWQPNKCPTPWREWPSWSPSRLCIVGTPERQEELACIIETSHGLLITSLLEAGLPIYPVNPKTVDRHRKPAGAKTDAIDAYLLARTGRSDFADLRRLRPDSALIQELKALTRDQESLIASQTRLVNQLTACLKSYYPVALTLFSKLQQPSTLAFLQAYPTPQAAEQASLEAITQVLKQAKHRRLAGISQRMWEQLRQPSLQADAITTRTRIALDAGVGPATPPARFPSWPLTTKRLLACFKRMRISPSLADCQGQASVLRLDSWPSGAMTAHAIRMPPASKPWEAPRPSPLRAANLPRCEPRHACIKPLPSALFQFARAVHVSGTLGRGLLPAQTQGRQNA
jgi:hypothetical protein